MAFWTYSGGDGYPTTRRIAVPTWQDVRENYPLTVRERLGSLMTDAFRPAKGGQLLLWHGAPGTGKTFALRALAWEWRSWCDVHYITDPEVLFGAGSDYLVDVLLDDDDRYHKHRHDGAGQDGDAAQRWRLLVVEDTRRAPLRRRQRGARGKACRGCSTSSTA